VKVKRVNKKYTENFVANTEDLYGWRYFCPEKLVELVSYVGITVGLV